MSEPVLRAATYVRMSTDHQQYSVANQTAALLAYAAAEGYQVVREFADEGISGLTLERRQGLKALLAEVLRPEHSFDIILVYDVSRWGRFQDPDQAAHYEFICRQVGVRVEYVAEQFANDGSLAATILKHLKRAMAAEFSRELSVKVSDGKRRIAAEGYWVGGPEAYGLRRQLILKSGQMGPILEPGQTKALQTDRVVLVQGPPEEVATVARIFRLFVVAGMTRRHIAATLNHEGVPANRGGLWTERHVTTVLKDSRYLGLSVFGRMVGRLGAPPRLQAPDTWVVVAGRHGPLVSEELFALAQRQLKNRRARRSRERLLEDLRAILLTHGRLSADLIDETEDAACASAYRKRFGSLVEAYRLIGYAPTSRQIEAARVLLARGDRRQPALAMQRSDDELVDDLRTLLREKGRLSVELITADPRMEHAEAYRYRLGGMRRAYALAGYAPTAFQERQMDLHGGQSITLDEAEVLRRTVSQGTSSPA